MDPADYDWTSVIEAEHEPKIGPQFSIMVKLAYLENVRSIGLSSSPLHRRWPGSSKRWHRWSRCAGNQVRRFRASVMPCAAIASEETLLRFARRTRLSHTAPPEWQPHLPMAGFLPPAPQPEVMRAGVLGQYGQDPRIMASIPPPPPPEGDDDKDPPKPKLELY